jgi:SAM-dependent methyltransferase
MRPREAIEARGATERAVNGQTHIPSHWNEADWERKARENPLHAIMTIAEYRNLTLDDLAAGAPAAFLQKGRDIYQNLVARFLTPEERGRSLDMFDYGCGAGRIMNAVFEAGHLASGADISPTMIEACGAIVPKSNLRAVVGTDGAVPAPSASFDVVYSFAVVQHIKSLAAHDRAIDEMIRVLRPGGLLSIQVNCEDFDTGNEHAPGFTVNFEEYSVHFKSPEEGPTRVHEQDNWSGVYVGLDRLLAQLENGGMRVDQVWNWNPKKRRAMVFTARKSPGESVLKPRKDPFSTVSAAMYRALLKKYARVAMDRSRLKKQLAELSKGAEG